MNTWGLHVVLRRRPADARDGLEFLGRRCPRSEAVTRICFPSEPVETSKNSLQSISDGC